MAKDKSKKIKELRKKLDKIEKRRNKAQKKHDQKLKKFENKEVRLLAKIGKSESSDDSSSGTPLDEEDIAENARTLAPKQASSRRIVSAEGRKRIAEAQRKRWAQNKKKKKVLAAL